MLNGPLIHPQILAALAAAGHGALVLIADGNYSAATNAAPGAPRVYLNLTPGLVNATDVLAALVSATPLEAAVVMQPADGPEPPIFAEFRALLPEHTPLTALDRFGFYALARTPDVALVIMTGEVRLYANIMLTIGVRPPR